MQSKKNVSQSTPNNTAVARRAHVAEVIASAAHSAQLGRTYEAELISAGLPPSVLASLERALAAALTAVQQRELESVRRATLSAQIAALLIEIARLRKKLISAFKTLRRFHPSTALPAEVARLHRPNQAPQALAWLAASRAAVEAHDAQLSSVMGLAVARRLRDLSAALSSAIEQRKESVLALRDLTIALHAAVAPMPSIVADIKTVAQNAFADQAAVLKQFRAPRRRKRAQVTAAKKAAAAGNAVRAEAAAASAPTDASKAAPTKAAPVTAEAAHAAGAANDESVAALRVARRASRGPRLPSRIARRAPPHLLRRSRISRAIASCSALGSWRRAGSITASSRARCSSKSLPSCAEVPAKAGASAARRSG